MPVGGRNRLRNRKRRQHSWQVVISSWLTSDGEDRLANPFCSRFAPRWLIKMAASTRGSPPQQRVLRAALVGLATLGLIIYALSRPSSGGFAGASKSGGGGGGGGSDGSALAPFINFSYDPLKHASGEAAAADTPPPQRRPGFQAAENANQAKYDKMWTGSSSYQKGSCWGCRFVGDVVTKLDFHTVLDAGTGEDGDC